MALVVVALLKAGKEFHRRHTGDAIVVHNDRRVEDLAAGGDEDVGARRGGNA